MKRIQKVWLANVPWQTVLSINQALCQTQKTEHKPGKGYVKAQQQWLAATQKAMTFPDALQVCRKCFDQSPFAFNNGNTFAAIARTLVEDFLKSVPPVEAQIVRTTVAHYVAGLVGKSELLNILDHFEPVLRSAAAEPHKISASAKPANPGPVAAPIQSVQPSS